MNQTSCAWSLFDHFVRVDDADETLAALDTVPFTSAAAFALASLADRCGVVLTAAALAARPEMGEPWIETSCPDLVTFAFSPLLNTVRPRTDWVQEMWWMPAMS